MTSFFDVARAIKGRILRGPAEHFQPSPEWAELQRRLERASSVVDLGCGANPHPRAQVAVDAYLEPTQRAFGFGATIDVEGLQRRGIRFVQANLESLPFADKEFDFAYSHHVFEHLHDPASACREMRRVARAGAIVTPSVFAEFAFGRPYHLWFVMARGNRLIFIRKRAPEDRPFGDHPAPKASGGYTVSPHTNPFDLLLNDGNWYRGREKMPRLGRLLRRHWYSHSPVIDVVFLWEGSFEVTVIGDDGGLS